MSAEKRDFQTALHEYMVRRILCDTMIKAALGATVASHHFFKIAAVPSPFMKAGHAFLGMLFLVYAGRELYRYWRLRKGEWVPL
jgi:hypothetical protein